MKMSDEKLDKLFERMSTSAAEKMNGTRPPKKASPAKKKTTKKVAKKK